MANCEDVLALWKERLAQEERLARAVALSSSEFMDCARAGEIKVRTWSGHVCSAPLSANLAAMPRLESHEQAINELKAANDESMDCARLSERKRPRDHELYENKTNTGKREDCVRAPISSPAPLTSVSAA